MSDSLEDQDTIIDGEDSDSIRRMFKRISKISSANNRGLPEPDLEGKVDTNTLVQWAVLGDGKYTAISRSVDTLPAGVFTVNVSSAGGLVFEGVQIVSDEIVNFPSGVNKRVLESIQTFWRNKDKFKEKGQLHKRGVLLWGPPGGGKTTLLTMLMNDLVDNNGLVILCANPGLTTAGLSQIRRIEPDRPVICVMEDIDDIIDSYGDSSILSMLSGENQINNIVNIATTNYPQELDDRITNRPGRFDEVIKIGMPDQDTRRAYLRAKLSKEELSDKDLDIWLKDTKDMSIAHLRELIVSTYCIGESYKSVITRLKNLGKKSISDSKEGVGFLHSANA